MTSVLFFGSSSYSVPVLESLHKLSDYTVLGVVTKPDKPYGRNKTISPNPVARFAAGHNLPLYQPEDFNPSFVTVFRRLKPDLALVVAYGPPFFTPEMLDIPRFKIVNIHPSPLPKYRGATPAPWQIIKGETTSAVTFFQIDELPDHGPIITQIPFDITPSETSDSLYQKAFGLSAVNLSQVLDGYLANPAAVTHQDHSLKSYFPKLDKNKAQIDWSQPPSQVERFVRAMQPWPVAWTHVTDQNGKRLRMKVMTSHLDSSGYLILDQVQVENKNPTHWSQIKSYYSLVKP